MTSAVRKVIGKTLSEFWPLLPAEKTLLSACELGKIAIVGKVCPIFEDNLVEVRATFLRFLALGGDDKTNIHEHGIQLNGAWISGHLSLRGASLPKSLELTQCYFSECINFMDARISDGLNLSGSQFKAKDSLGDALIASRAKIIGALLLKSITSYGQIKLSQIHVEGSVDFNASIVICTEKEALTANRAFIKHSLLLHNTIIEGQIQLGGAKINGALDFQSCSIIHPKLAIYARDICVDNSVFFNNAVISGEIFFKGAYINKDLIFEKATLLNLTNEIQSLTIDGAEIKGAFKFRYLKKPVNNISLESLSVAQLIDDEFSWGTNLILDGFTYKNITGDAPTDAQSRHLWLDKQISKHRSKEGKNEFRPQPWTQLHKTLREMGHIEGARQIAIKLEHRLREADLIGKAPSDWKPLRAWIYKKFARICHGLFSWLIGFGYRPIRLGSWMLLVWFLCSIWYWYVALQGVMGPSNPLIFQNIKYAACVPESNDASKEFEKLALNKLGQANGLVVSKDYLAVKGAGNWYLCETLPQEYTGFSPMAYSLDVLLPLVNLQQEADWAPLIPTPNEVWYKELHNIFNLKHATRMIVWLEILFGWIASLLMVAVVSGLTKRRED